MEEKEYKDYVKKELWKEFRSYCKKNSLDFYSCGVVLTAHLTMKYLTQHLHPFKVKRQIVMKYDKETPKEAWESAMKQTDYHSGFSAGCVARTIERYSPRGKEFFKWFKKEHGG